MRNDHTVRVLGSANTARTHVGPMFVTVSRKSGTRVQGLLVSKAEGARNLAFMRNTDGALAFRKQDPSDDKKWTAMPLPSIAAEIWVTGLRENDVIESVRVGRSAHRSKERRKYWIRSLMNGTKTVEDPLLNATREAKQMPPMEFKTQLVRLGK